MWRLIFRHKADDHSYSVLWTDKLKFRGKNFILFFQYKAKYKWPNIYLNPKVLNKYKHNKLKIYWEMMWKLKSIFHKGEII